MKTRDLSEVNPDINGAGNGLRNRLACCISIALASLGAGIAIGLAIYHWFFAT
jgi:hypothetical protein